MSGMEVVLPYLAGASLVNTVYGAVTGTPGGLIGEIFGADEPAKPAAAAPAPAPAPAPTPAPVPEPAKAEAPAAAPIAPPTLTATPAAATLLSDPTPVPVVSLAKPPEVTKPTPMPNLNDAAVQAAKKASIAEQLRRRGRASTILTDGASYDPLG